MNFLYINEMKELITVNRNKYCVITDENIFLTNAYFLMYFVILYQKFGCGLKDQVGVFAIK